MNEETKKILEQHNKSLETITNVLKGLVCRMESLENELKKHKCLYEAHKR